MNLDDLMLDSYNTSIASYTGGITIDIDVLAQTSWDGGSKSGAANCGPLKIDRTLPTVLTSQGAIENSTLDG